MPKKILLFAPCAFNLAETTRMLEIAKGVAHHPAASQVFEIHFMSDGGDFEHLIDEEGFPLQKMEPRLTKEKIEYIGKVDKGEIFAPAFTRQEINTRIEHEKRYLQELKPAAVLTGSYLTIPLSCRIEHIPLVWAIQSTWLKEFFTTGAGMTDTIKFKPLKRVADWLVFLFINFWVKNGFLNGLNKAARQYGVPGYPSIFDYWQGDVTIVAEPAEFSGAHPPAQALLHRAAYRQAELSPSGKDQEYCQRQTPGLFCHGKLRHSGNCGKYCREFRGETLPGNCAGEISPGSSFRGENS